MGTLMVILLTIMVVQQSKEASVKGRKIGMSNRLLVHLVNTLNNKVTHRHTQTNTKNEV